MRNIFVTAAGAIIGLSLACGSTADRSARAQEKLGCITMNTERLPLDTRLSPLDSVSFTVGGQPVKICYGRPSARDREIMSGLLPFGELWRTGANEPTMIHTATALDIAGIQIEPGSYSLYTIPGESQWTLIVNPSIEQWGEESNYTPEIQAQEVGRTTVEATGLDEHVEQFTIRATPLEEGDALVMLEWERTRVLIPVRSG